MTVATTSRRAYTTISPSLGRRQQEVLEAIKHLGFATNTEIARHLGWEINRITGRVNELREAKKVVQNGERPCRITGFMAKVWEAVEQDGQMHLL